MEEEMALVTPKTGSRQRGAAPAGKSIDIYAAQCDKCLKWRVIENQDDYEEIRFKNPEAPFVCKRKEGVTCEDPTDLDYDSSRTWVLDKPGIPKTPRGFKRSLVLRRDYSKLDAYYIAPTGKKMRTKNEVAAFIQANPEYNHASVADFVFTVPKVKEDTVPSLAIKASSSCVTADKNGKELEES